MLHGSFFFIILFKFKQYFQFNGKTTCDLLFSRLNGQRNELGIFLITVYAVPYSLRLALFNFDGYCR
jgi:hypothetical protein